MFAFAASEDLISNSLLDSLSVSSSNMKGFDKAQMFLNATKINNDAKTGAWKPQQGTEEYIEVDLARIQWVSQIETQGYSQEWVKSYTLSYSINQKDFLFILDYDGSRKIFKGNDDDTTLVRHEFGPYVARYVRLHPIDFHERATLQWKISYTGMPPKH